MFDRALNAALEYPHIVYGSLYGLNTFTKDLNKYQSLEKLFIDGLYK